MQALTSQACGHYAFFFLKLRARGHSMEEFLQDFSPTDYVCNDRFIRQALRRVIVRQLEGWEHACRLPYLQSCMSREVNCTLYKRRIKRIFGAKSRGVFSVAQWVAHPTSHRKDGGSNPPGDWHMHLSRKRGFFW